jgi:hypothetical protein
MVIRGKSKTPANRMADMGSIAPEAVRVFSDACPVLPESDSQPQKCVPSLKAISDIALYCSITSPASTSKLCGTVYRSATGEVSKTAAATQGKA